jgi:hypothetical protein
MEAKPMRHFFLFATSSVFTLCLAGCAGGAAGGVPTLDLAAAIDNPREFDISEIAHSIEYIPLDESVPVGEIAVLGGLKPAAAGFYIADAEQMSPIQHFDRSGKFVSTVGRMGRGSGETTFVQGIASNFATGEVYIDGVTDIVGLDAEGREFARMTPELNWGMVWHGERLLALPVPSLFDDDAYAGDTIPFIEMFDRDLKPIGSIHGPNVGPFLGMPTTPQAEDYVAATDPPFLSDNGRRLLVKQGRGDTLYHYSAGTISPAYVLKLGRYAPEAEMFGLNPSAQWGERTLTVDNVWEGDRWLIVSAINPRQMKQPRCLVFDRLNLTDGGFSAMGGADDMSGLFAGGVVFTPAYIRDNRLVGYVSALDIVDNADGITDPELKKIAETIKEESNPVIVIVELKK